MSEEQRVFPIRPPSGTWPPGPWPGPGPFPPPAPPFPRPPDFFSWFFWLNQNYEDAKQARVFFKRILADLLQDDPALLASAQAQIGVTDGSDAQPGMVGEFVMFTKSNIPIPAAYLVQQVTLGVLQPGDWDCWAHMTFSSFVADGRLALNPVPAGFSESMYTGDTSNFEEFSLTTPAVRGLISQPVLINFQVTSNLVSSAPADTEAYLVFQARRRR